MNEREFVEIINTTHWEVILQLEKNYPNISPENLILMLIIYSTNSDELAPYKKFSKKEFKLKSKPCISKDIQFLMWQRDKLFQSYCNETNSNKKELLHIKYKTSRNKLIKKKTESKFNYYQTYYADNSKKKSAIWKGIRMMKIKSYSNRDILILHNKDMMIIDPIEISKICFHGPKN